MELRERLQRGRYGEDEPYLLYSPLEDFFLGRLGLIEPEY